MPNGSRAPDDGASTDSSITKPPQFLVVVAVAAAVGGVVGALVGQLIGAG